MEENYLEIVDKVVMKAFNDGYAIPQNDLWDVYAVRYRLELYGRREGQHYYLNELGLRYAMGGCSEGVKRKQAKDEYIDDLNIEATKKAMADADRAYVQSEKAIAQADKALNHSSIGNRISKWALVVSILSILCQVLQPILEKVLQELQE